MEEAKIKFSILMSIYDKERPEYFDRCMQSIWDEQTIKPDEIVLVQDGRLIGDLYSIINKWQKKVGGIFKTILLKENVGLGDALYIGLQYCSYELVARMDTDDISYPYRFEKQIKIFKNSDIDICSSWVSEFKNNKTEIISCRKLPESHNEIIKFAKKRNPINHPAVMFKKSVVQKAGGYKKMMWFEDYFLWIRVIMTGAKFFNISEPLVWMQTGDDLIERRRGLKYAINEFNFQKKMLDLGFVNYFEFCRNVIIRIISRTIPKIMLKKIYIKIKQY